VSDLWLEKWSSSRKYVLSREVFDHCAIVIKNKIIDWGAKPFRMFDVWAEMDGYRKVIREAWEQRVNCGNDLERVKMKLKGLKSALKKWRK